MPSIPIIQIPKTTKRREKISKQTGNTVLETAKNTYTHSEIMVIMGALMLVMLLAALDQTIVATALPRIAT
jgi:hypothetical protein